MRRIGMERFNQLISTGVQEGFSDLHITGGHPVVYRKNGVINFDKKGKWLHEEINELVRKLLNNRQMEMLERRLSVDFAMSIHHIRVRINVFNTTRGLSLAIRLLSGKAPLINNLNLHPSLQEFCRPASGLILICGTTGCGKSTTIAAMIEEINRTRSAHIVTLEDPVEYRFLSKQAFIEQRELGVNFPSFEQGLLDVLREDPDVIVVGELREPGTMKLTLNAAESGHLVIASLHATNSEDALYRICNSFSPESQNVVRSQLSSTLTLLVIQQLIYMDKINFRVPLLSILRGRQSVKGIIRDGKLAQIESAIQTGKGEGMFTMEQYRKEYINMRKHFTSPAETFKPSTEESPEILYPAPLVSGVHIKVEGPAFEVGEKAKMNFRQNSQDFGQYYVINEKAPMDELITTIKKSDKF